MLSLEVLVENLKRKIIQETKFHVCKNADMQAFHSVQCQVKRF